MTFETDRYSRRWLLGALLTTAATSACGNPPTTSPRPPARAGTVPATARAGADDLVAAAALGGATGYVLADAETGAVLEAGAPDRAMPPASVAKAMTSLYALDRLGSAHRFTTRVLATGPVSGGNVQGDLILAGSGDPMLSTDQLGDMAAALRARGVTGVTGRYLVWSGALPDIGRIAPDQPDHVGYNPAISGLNLNFNRVHFQWKRGAKGYELTMDARAERFMPAVSMARMSVVNRDLPVYTYTARDGGDQWTVAATALGRAGSRWLPVRHPDRYAAEVFQTLARAQGIRLPDPKSAASLPAGTVLAQTASTPLTEVLRDMLKYSTNLTAEVVGLTASGGPASLSASGQQMTDWARGRYGTGARFVDHSGLGAASRISAGDMVRALVAARSSPLPGLMKDIGMRDADGREIKGHPVSVIGKTGTLNFVSGLAGYIQPPRGRRMAYAIFSADVARRDSLPLGQREMPPGGPQWTKRARLLQARLIDRWVAVHA